MQKKIYIWHDDHDDAKLQQRIFLLAQKIEEEEWYLKTKK